jgi:hypothetical protein
LRISITSSKSSFGLSTRAILADVVPPDDHTLPTSPIRGSCRRDAPTRLGRRLRRSLVQRGPSHKGIPGRREPG